MPNSDISTLPQPQSESQQQHQQQQQQQPQGATAIPNTLPLLQLRGSSAQETSPVQGYESETTLSPTVGQQQEPKNSSNNSNSKQLSLHLDHSTTIIRQGLVTPTTPSFLPQNSAEGQSEFQEYPFPASTTTDNMENLNITSPTTPESPDDEFGLSIEEFEKHYVPLSHLPTPPLSDSCSMNLVTSDIDEGTEERIDPEFWGPAKFLSSMVPRLAWREPPSTRMLAAVLQRANLKLGVVSLACCVLDCLSDRFLRNWRRECSQQDGRPERSEILAVVALMLSMKFMEDSAYSNRIWAGSICEGEFALRTLNLTERLMLEDLNHSLLGLMQPELLDWNIGEIRRYTEEAAGRFGGTIAPTPPPPADASDFGKKPSSSYAAKTPFPLAAFS